MKINKKALKNINVFSVIVFVVLTLYIVSLVVPLVWGFLTSFKSRGDYVMNMYGFPEEFKWENYVTAFEHFKVETDKNGMVYIEEMLLYTLLYAGGCAFFQVFFNCIAGYCCAKFSRFAITGVYTGIVIVTMAIPIVGSQASELAILINLKLYDNMLGMWIMKMNFSGIYYLIFLETFHAIPKDYSEAAYIDGAGNFTLFFKLMLPFVSKTFLTVFLIYFIGYWNDYQLPMLYLPSYPTLAYGLYEYSFSANPKISSVPMKMAGCMILFVPIFIVFVCMQKYLLGNVQMGGLKG